MKICTKENLYQGRGTMDKNIVFIIAVKKDGQLKSEYEIGIESWRRWCKKNDVDLFLLEEPILWISIAWFTMTEVMIGN